MYDSTRCLCLLASLVTLLSCRPVLGEDTADGSGLLNLDASLALFAPAQAVPASEARASWQDVKPRDQMEKIGYYFRGGGMILEQQNDGRQANGDPIEFNTGGGFSLALGYRLGGDVPISVEGEYAYRHADADSAGGGDGSIKLHSLTFNVMLDLPDLIGPVGFYAGMGLGIRIDKFAFSSSSGNATAGISGDGFFWQARGGLTISITPRTQLYAGVIWADGGTSDSITQSVDVEMVGAEFGFRLFF